MKNTESQGRAIKSHLKLMDMEKRRKMMGKPSTMETINKSQY